MVFVSRINIFVFLLLLVLLMGRGCVDSDNTLFVSLSPEDTGITFSNDIEESSEFNIINYLYFYDGGGVSVGDVNDDGLPDLFFTGNMISNRLYLNKGNFNFEDITEQAGVAGSGDWTSGSTMADVNGDGYLDIYVSNVNYLSNEGQNELFINNGDLSFTEQAEAYGLNFEGYAKQAAFFDYDNDGDLDVYLLNHAIHTKGSFVHSDYRSGTDSLAGDRLYRNEGEQFSDVTKEAGIYSSSLGYGLAVGISDLNNDGCQDIYISNDFHENDYLYQNNCDGTFSEVLEKSMGHTSRASMGNDIADINNDGFTDIFVADMLPMTEKGLKKVVSSEAYKVYRAQRDFGYHPQLIRNTLQLNMGESPDKQLRFSEIAQFSNVNATDWSWSSLFFDMNNDGYKDLFVTNGIYRRPNDLDYLLYVRREQTQELLNKGGDRAYTQVIEAMPHTEIPNVGFLNNGDLTFSDESRELGFDEPSYSNGAAYADLDNDGDLDLIINNVNSTASVYKNMTRERNEGNYIKAVLRGPDKNTMGVGSKVVIYDSSSTQHYEVQVTKGFLSSVNPQLTIGLGESKGADSLLVIWPDQRYQILRDVSSNQTITLNHTDAGGSYRHYNQRNRKGTPLFNNVTSDLALDYNHEEDSFVDFNRQPLTPFMLSSQGPCITVEDMNGDGLDDFFVCGAKWQAGNLFIQKKNGSFEGKKLPDLKRDAAYEDVDAASFDANGDGIPDLYVVSGGNEHSYQSDGLSDRLYLNDGYGNLVKVNDALPNVNENGAVVKASDYNNDGDIDLFVGSRSVPGNYGLTPNSYLFENMGKGQFRDVTEKIAPGLKQAGMITDAKWSDINGDGTPDLFVVGEWMSPHLFLNKNGKLIDSTKEAGLSELYGFWQSVEIADFDNDGDLDIIVGNLGTNSFLKASMKEPLVLYLNDFDNNGQIDPIMGYTVNNKEYPVAPRDELLTQLEFLQPKFNSYEQYAGKTIQEIFEDALTKGSWEKKKVYTLRSLYLENKGDGMFNMRPLPDRVQWAPVLAMTTGDFNYDGKNDLLLGGGIYDVKPSIGGRYDASYGWYLEGSGGGHFSVLDLKKSGFILNGEIRDIEQLNSFGEKPLILVSKNDGPLSIFTLSRKN